jgi:hypothetical protein
MSDSQNTNPRIDTPNNIDVLLHYHCSPDKHPRINAPAVREAIDFLLVEGCLVPVADSPGNLLYTTTYTTTQRGQAWVAALCNVRVPRNVFVDEQNNILFV